MFKMTVVFLVALSSMSEAHAISIGDPFPGTGAKATFKAVGQVLSGAPLPSLDGGRKVVITPQIGIMKVDANNDAAAEMDEMNPGFKRRFYGQANGHSAGLTIAFNLSEDFSVFISGGGAWLSGEFSQELNDQPDQNLTEFNGQTAAGAIGIQYRLIGTDDSKFALGVFTGPMYYSSQATGKLQKASAGSSLSSMSFNPSGLGEMFGLQFVIRLGNFRINPYLKLMVDSDMCKEIELEGGPYVASEFSCEDKQGSIASPAYAGGYGLLVGYKSFLITVFSDSADSDTLKPTSTNISFGISL